ncbi:MAG: DNA repair protein [Lachnospiraceae bacterium]|nr:DNA repair protein [Lachnospiraceae bacterium]
MHDTISTSSSSDCSTHLVRYYMCIDFKSFYASVECVERGLDPLTAKLVVADPDRSKGTICLAVSPALKALGVKNRCRIFEIPDSIDYVVAKPRMQLYIDYSARIYKLYLKYLSKDDIQVYSIDESFMDVTDYLSLYKCTPRELASKIMAEVLSTTGIPSACGIGTNIYLAKVALDITAKHSPDRISFLNEDLYKKSLWRHKPLTDFWQIGNGISNKLARLGITTMEELANTDTELLYKTFGINASYLIDHAWGKEPTTISRIKAYECSSHSLSSGQVLMRDYKFEEASIILKEMVDLLCLDLVDKHLITDNIFLHIGYSNYVLPSLNKSKKLSTPTSSCRILTDSFIKLYNESVDRTTPIRRISITFGKVFDESFEQYDLFYDTTMLEKERSIQHSVNEIKHRFGKNAILKGMNLLDCATTQQRNSQIGGHNA